MFRLRQVSKKDNIAKSRPQVVAKVRGPPHRPRRLHGQALYMFHSRMPASCGGYDVDCDDDDDGDDGDVFCQIRKHVLACRTLQVLQNV